jgi:hypothetical protein
MPAPPFLNQFLELTWDELPGFELTWDELPGFLLGDHALAGMNWNGQDVPKQHESRVT